MRTGVKKKFWQDVRTVPYLYILPNMILFISFMIIPLIMTFYYSMMKWNGLGKPKFIGLKNYLIIFNDPVFIKALVNTFLFTAVTVPLIMIFSMFFAVILNEKMPFRGFIRSAIYVPAVVSTVVAGTVFTWLFQDQIGMINYVIQLFGGQGIQWVSNPKYAMIMIVVATVWQRTGYNMVIYLAGLQGINSSLYEAAMIDGANSWQKFRHVVFPLLRNTHIFVIVTCMIYTFRSFDLIYMMTGGGPLNATETIVMYAYQEAFTKNNFGRSSAAGVILFIIMFVFTIIRSRAERRDK